jgi:molybdate/tungstate transport system substrate-binding protein
VAYAGSLQLENESIVGPKFESVTGASYQGRGAGSLGLAHELLSGTITADVFESVGAKPIEMLEPRLTTWYAQFASSPLVIAYNPKGRFASTFEKVASGEKPLADAFEAMAEPGFHLGRTNPETDPQGQAFIEMVELAQKSLGLRTGIVGEILGGTENPAQIFAETALDAHLQAGQLDAASAYLPQAVEKHLPYVSLPSSIDLGDPSRAPEYATASVVLPDGTTVHGAPITIDVTTLSAPGTSRRAAVAFVAFVLSSDGRKLMEEGGYTLVPVKLFGRLSMVPQALREVVPAS